MSGQGTQRVRRIASPSTKQGPLKATQHFGLVPGSPTKSANGRKTSPSTSPTHQWSSEGHRSKSRRSPDSRTSPDRSSPSSPGLKERSKPVRHSPVSCMKRTGSLDAIAGLYQSGQWPRDPRELGQTAPSPCVDKCTQTPDEWEDNSLERIRKARHKRSASVGNGDSRKEKLWSKKSELTRSSNTGHQRTSPVPTGNLSLLTTLPPPSGGLHMTSKTVGIPTASKRSVIRIPGSVEGPSTEIEHALNISGIDEIRSADHMPDGHHAPVRELLASRTRSIDTQTPSGYVDGTRPLGEHHSPLSEGEEHTLRTSNSRGSQSESPCVPIIIGQMDSSRPSSLTESPRDLRDLRDLREANKENDRDADNLEQLHEKDLERLSPYDHKCNPSPKPNKSFSFVREPPDGCEKVKIFEEPRGGAPPLKEPLMSCPVKKPGSYRIPSQGSAFNPPYKLCQQAAVSPLPFATALDN